MPTDEINAGQDQDQTNTTDQVDGSVDEGFNFKKASKTLSEQLNKATARIEELEEKLNPQASEEEEPVEDDLDTKIKKAAEEVVSRKTWYATNKDRIEKLSEENKEVFENKSKTMDLSDALTIAESNEPYKVTTKEKYHSPSGSVSRSAPEFQETEQDRANRERFGVDKKTVEENKAILDELIG